MNNVGKEGKLIKSRAWYFGVTMLPLALSFNANRGGFSHLVAKQS